MRDTDPIHLPDSPTARAELSDEQLLTLARKGSRQAFAELFSRHTYGAHRLARHLGLKEEAEDVVTEAFARVLDLVGRGKGPEQAFRPYLLATIRHEAGRRAVLRRRVTPTADDRLIDQPVAFNGGGLDAFERSAIVGAFQSLPERWRMVLWHLDVEGRKPHELAGILGVSANSVSALVYRARSALREAYVQQHVRDDLVNSSRACRDIRARLSAFVRQTVSERERETIYVHV